jgi:hypothetical protein
MKRLAVLAALAAALTTGCASKPFTGQHTPWPSPAGGSKSPWMTAYGCDAVVAARFGQKC